MPAIMIVDDDDLVAERASSILIEAGYPCGWVSSGQEALDSLRWRRPDVLLLDHDMPEMTGRELLRELRKSPDLYDLPVIMFTAMDGEEDEQQCRYAGAQAYIRKPFDPQFLILKVREVLATRRDHPGHRTLDELAMMQTRSAPKRETGGFRSC